MARAVPLPPIQDSPESADTCVVHVFTCAVYLPLHVGLKKAPAGVGHLLLPGICTHLAPGAISSTSFLPRFPETMNPPSPRPYQRSAADEKPRMPSQACTEHSLGTGPLQGRCRAVSSRRTGSWLCPQPGTDTFLAPFPLRPPSQQGLCRVLSAAQSSPSALAPLSGPAASLN